MRGCEWEVPQHGDTSDTVIPVLDFINIWPNVWFCCNLVWLVVSLVCHVVYARVCVHVCVYMCVYVCMCICVYMCVCVYVCICVCVYVCIYVYVYVCICVYVYVCVRACMCVLCNARHRLKCICILYSIRTLT